MIAAGVDPETAERDACRMEHVISQDSFEHLTGCLQNKRRINCPHGKRVKQ